MKALLAQLDPTPDPAVNAARAAELVAGGADNDLVLFPELFLGGYATTDLEDRAVPAGDPRLEMIGEACRASGTAAIAGFTEELPGAAGFANSAACFDGDGRLVAVYRKANLFGAAETEAFEPGDRLRVVALGGARVGLLICFDAEFPEPARSLAEAGADLLVTIAANMASYEEDHRLATRARALDNRLSHLYVNRVGEESGYRFVGSSRAVAPNGDVIAELGDDEDTLPVTVGIGERPDEAVDYLRLRKPDLPVRGGGGNPEGEV